MSKRIPDTTVQEVLRLTNLETLVGEYVSLKRAGTSVTGLCPFHDEKTSSFHVHASRGFYYCFGCHASGDAISFLRELNGLSFEEALRFLAERVGVPIEVAEGPAADEQRRRSAERKEMRRVNQLAAEFYHQQLRSTTDPRVRSFMNTRGLTPGIAETFFLGYAPQAWDELTRHLQRNNVDPAVVELLGLIVRKDGASGHRHYDRFRDRVMFPVFDLSGEVIAFGGRTIENDKKVAKYINSPDSALYRKGDVLFGLQAAKKQIKADGYAILVEGNIDLMRMHDAGFVNTVAPMGTALTLNQVALLRRFTERLVLIYDGDQAGAQAAEKSLAHWLEAGIDARLVVLPEGEDPDSYLQRFGAEALREAIDKSFPLLDVMLDRRIRVTGQTPRAKARIIEEFVGYFHKIGDALTRELYVRKLSQRTKVDEETIWRRYNGEADPRATQAPTAATDVTKRRALAVDLKNPRRKAERELVCFLVQNPHFLPQAGQETVDQKITDPELQRCVSNMVTEYTERGAIDVARTVALIGEPDTRSQLAQALIVDGDPETGSEAEQYKALLQALDRFQHRSEQRRLQHEIESRQTDDVKRQIDILRTKQDRLKAMLKHSSPNAEPRQE